MRIVVIGGWAPSLLNFRKPLLEALVARGHEIHALAPHGDAELARRLARLGVEFEDIPLARTGLDPREDLRSLCVLIRRLRVIEPDVVLSYTIKPIIYGSLAARFSGARQRAALVTGLGYVFTTRPKTAVQRAARFAVSRLYRLGLASCQTVFVQNPDDARELVALGALSPRQRVVIVRGSGVDIDEFPLMPLPAGPLRFLFMGRLLRDKGIHEYVEAARAVRAQRSDVVFSVLGWLDANPTSVTRDQLDAWCRDGVIEYLGATSDVRSFLAAAHVLVLPSYREGTPRSVLEAMSMGRAVITTDVPGSRETVVDGESGKLVPPADAAAIADAATSLIHDRVLLEKLAREGRARVERLYDARKVAAHMLEVLGL